MRMRLVALVLGVAAVSRRARADDEPRVIGSAAVGASTYGDVTLDLGLRFALLDEFRLGALAMGTVSVAGCCEGHLRFLVTADYAIHRAADVSIWLGAGGGPSLFLSGGTVTPGATALVALDVALPLSRLLAFDIIVRGGLDEDGDVAWFGQLAVGLTWGGASRPVTRL
jgi:hypothetical protein